MVREVRFSGDDDELRIELDGLAELWPTDEEDLEEWLNRPSDDLWEVSREDRTHPDHERAVRADVPATIDERLLPNEGVSPAAEEAK